MNFSEENRNFFRLYYVITNYGTIAMNELLRLLIQHTCSPSYFTFTQFVALPQVINDLRPRNCLDPHQRELLYPTGSTCTSLNYGDLDISLVTTLLKNVSLFSGTLQQPRNPYCPSGLWTKPTEADKSLYPLEAAIVLLKNERNLLSHSKEPVLPGDFNTRFDSAKSLVMHLMRHTGSVAFSEDEIEQCRTNPLSTDIIEHLKEELLQSVEAINELKDAIRNLVAEQAQTENRVVKKVMEEMGNIYSWKKMTKKTRFFVISFLVLAGLILGLLLWNRITLSSIAKFDKHFEKEKKSKEERINKYDDIMGKESTKPKTFIKGDSKNIRGKRRLILSRVEMKRGETSRDIQIRKNRLYHAIKMNPVICSFWINKGESLKKKDIDKCMERVLKLSTRGSFLALPSSFLEKHGPESTPARPTVKTTGQKLEDSKRKLMMSTGSQAEEFNPNVQRIDKSTGPHAEDSKRKLIMSVGGQGEEFIPNVQPTDKPTGPHAEDSKRKLIMSVGGQGEEFNPQSMKPAGRKVKDSNRKFMMNTLTKKTRKFPAKAARIKMFRDEL